MALRCPSPGFHVRPMRLADLDRVLHIERLSFPTPWPRSAYRYELEHNQRATYLVLVSHDEGEQLLGYVGFWVVVDEAHIATIAVDPRARRRGLGALLLLRAMEDAQRQGAQTVTLEVRRSNLAAQALYAKFGFRQLGLRPAYYADNREDALLLGTPRISEPGYSRQLARLKEEVEGRPR